MCAAIAAARQGSPVRLLEQGKIPGKKILATGNGKCNYTNRKMEASCFRSENEAGIGAVLAQYPAPAIVAFFEELGIRPSERNGYFYPASHQASSVRKALELECRHLGVEICTEVRAETVRFRKGRFALETSRGQMSCRKLILSCGSCAAPKTGSDGSGYRLAASLGHRIVKPVPALVQLTGEEPFYRDWAGVRVYGKAELYVEGRLAASDCGELQLTKYGISGIPVFQVSRFASRALSEGRKISAALNFFPDDRPDDFRKKTAAFLENQSYKTLADSLCGMLPDKLVLVLLQRSGLSPKCRWKELPRSRQEKLLALTQNFPVAVTGTKSFEEAQVCAGGVSLAEIRPETMESRLVPGLYLTGELLDADGICGGYNLHWAWSTGLIAGMNAGKEQI